MFFSALCGWWSKIEDTWWLRWMILVGEGGWLVLEPTTDGMGR